jgi:hypothetical protein
VGVFLMLAVVMAKFYKPTVGAGQPQPTRQLPAQQEPPQAALPGIPYETAETGEENADANAFGE